MASSIMIGPAFSKLCPDSAAFKEAARMIPPAIYSDVTCFRFYDHHPGARIKLDITVCTSKGEFIELFKRQPVTTFKLDTTTSPTAISINRTMQCERYYLIKAGDVLFHLFIKDNGKMTLKSVTNVKKYVVGELQCKVFTADDALPEIYNEYFEKVGDLSINSAAATDDDVIDKSLQTLLDIKLTEARHNLAYNLKALEKMRKMRQCAAYLLYKEIHPVLRKTVFNDGYEAIANAVQIKTGKPWIKTCNKKVVMVIGVINGNAETLKEVQVLIHERNISCLNYVSKVYRELPAAPFWRECRYHNVTKDNEAKIAVVMDLDELKLDSTNQIEFCGVLVYRINGVEKLLPFQEVTLSYLDVMSESFNALSANVLSKEDILAVLATSEKSDLLFNRVLDDEYSEDDDNNSILSELLISYNDMEKVTESNRLLVHRRSPYHVLNGVAVVIHEGHKDNLCHVYVNKVSVYAQKESQVISLIHYINDAVPKRIVITPTDCRIVPLNTELPEEEIPQPKLNIKAYGESVLKQMMMLKDYFDQCILKMHESPDVRIRNLIGSKIDIYACGKTAFLEFKEKFNEEVQVGLSKLYGDDDEEDD